MQRHQGVLLYRLSYLPHNTKQLVRRGKSSSVRIIQLVRIIAILPLFSISKSIIYRCPYLSYSVEVASLYSVSDNIWSRKILASFAVNPKTEEKTIALCLPRG